MASAELSHRVERVVGYPPLSEVNAGQRREFHKALLNADDFDDLPGKWQAGDPQSRAGRNCGSSAVTEFVATPRMVVSGAPACVTPESATLQHSRLMAKKRCPKCGEAKPQDAFPTQRKQPDGRSPWCRACHAVGNREYRTRHRERLNAARRRDAIPERTCRTCGQTFMPVREDQRYCRTWCREHKYLTRLESESPLGPADPRCPAHG